VDGTVGADQGGILIYIKDEDAANYMLQWRNHVIAKYSSIAGFRDWNCSSRHPYAFFSECVYRKTGQPFKVSPYLDSPCSVRLAKTMRMLRPPRRSVLMSHAKRQGGWQRQHSIDAAALAKSLEELATMRHSDADLKAAAEKARTTAEKVEETAKAVRGALPARKRTRTASSQRGSR